MTTASGSPREERQKRVRILLAGGEEAKRFYDQEFAATRHKIDIEERKHPLGFQAPRRDPR